MTHTVHPYAHRLGIIRDWKSRWFAKTPLEYRTNVIIDAFVIVIIGGLGSLLGSTIGSLLVGTIQTFGNFLVVKMLGFTLAVAVFIDATLVRIVIGPALLRVAGDWNWWPGGLAARSVPVMASGE